MRYLFRKQQGNHSSSSHLAVRLPEIVAHILSYLAASIPHDDNHRQYKNTCGYLYPCLFVNHLWHDCAQRLLWRHVLFDDTKADYEAFLRFVSSVVNSLPPPRLSTTAAAAAALAVAVPIPKPRSNINYMAEVNAQYKPDHCIEQAKRIRVDRYRHAIRSLTLRKIKETNISEPLEALGRYLPRLERLDMYICDYVTNETLQRFISFGKLTYISLAGCFRVTDDAILKVAQYCRDLEHLDLRACGMVSDVSIAAIATCCPRLRHLNVGRIRDRERISIQSIGLIAVYTQVAVLGLAGCNIDDECMTMLAKHRNAGLERISVNHCHRLTNKSIRAFVRYCCNMTVFEMKECHCINDWESVAELVQRKVLLTLCDQQNRACTEWAKRKGRTMDVKAPSK
ncbi:Antagonist of MEN (Mitotic Exit Network) [Apophysomyces ossiformis]|uniref:Antagonist of MEN (Mitotic Exit Network) n=1 Tax=Apophysomyces ossiformis TaxID=679940 RepID=A0A8H7EU94_9FUNG|nr:Antagonist of MEN (Mitotic Exit Network) [Apophysomyces ossiformis]